MSVPPDPLAPARGLRNGFAIGCLLWVGIFVAAAVLLARCLP